MLAFKEICVCYKKKQVLDSLSFSLRPHRLTVVLGKNGCGKSTLVSCVTGGTPYTGEILYGDRNVALMPPRERARLIAVLPQILPKVSLTVEELVSMGRNPYLDLGRRLQKTDYEQIESAIRAVGMDGFRRCPLGCLSGGERQKAYLAMIIAQNTRIVILDEPTTYMDMENEADFLAFVKELKTVHKKTLMIVMHDLTKAVEIADDVLVIRDGGCAFFGTAKDCVESGVIEEVFHVKRSSYEKNGTARPLYYR